MRFTNTDVEALAKLSRWILILLIILITVNICYVIHVMIEGRKEKKRAKMIEADKLAWEAY